VQLFRKTSDGVVYQLRAASIIQVLLTCGTEQFVLQMQPREAGRDFIALSLVIS